MPTIMSIDVGMKNLAICVLSYTSPDPSEQTEQTPTTFQIHEWDVLNLTNPDMCQHHACPKPAQYHKYGQYYCRPHAKKTIIEGRQYHIPDKTNDLENLKKLNKAKLLAHILEHFPPTMFDTTVTQSTIKQYKKDELLNYVQSRLPPMYDTLQTRKTSEISFMELGKSLMTQLDPLLSLYSLDHVLIENQISPLANRMKTLQGMLTQYFIMRGVGNIEYISSSNKLKVAEWITSTDTETVTEKIANTTPNTISTKSYDKRKQSGIVLTTHILSVPMLTKQQPTSTSTYQLIPNTKNTLAEWSAHFTKHKKKDDLADSFLQGIWWMIAKG